MSAAASESSLATVQAGGGTTQAPMLGPCLFAGMGEAGMLERLNPLGVARHRALLDLLSLIYI